MVAVDFLVVPTIRFRIPFVFVVMSHDRRKVVRFNVTANPTAQWTAQQIVEFSPDHYLRETGIFICRFLIQLAWL